MARIVPSLVELPGVGVGPDRVEVKTLDRLVVSEVGRGEDPETVGRPAKRTELVSLTQLDEAGTRAV